VEHLTGSVGRERSLRELAQMLSFDVRTRGGLVGALHVTCADEAEAECAEAFQQGFVQYALPALKFARRSALRLSNIGGRYEWGVVRMADTHFALPKGAAPQPRLFVLKINAHMALEEVGAVVGADADGHAWDGERAIHFGQWTRYGCRSTCCGALDSLLHGGHEPWVEDLREAFASEGRDRLAALDDEQAVEPVYRPLYTALVSARLQARKAVLDIQDYTPAWPTEYLVLACVSLNRHERDTEILCGVYTVERGNESDPEVTYVGLGDDPGKYRLRFQNRLIQVTDDQIGSARAGRDHRALVRSEWQARRAPQPRHRHEERLEQIRHDVEHGRHRHDQHARALLRMALPILAEVMPASAAVILFTEGAVGIHHAFRAHRLAREMGGSEDARKILAEVHERIDRLEPERAAALIELLMHEYRR